MLKRIASESCCHEALAKVGGGGFVFGSQQSFGTGGGQLHILEDIETAGLGGVGRPPLSGFLPNHCFLGKGRAEKQGPWTA